MKVIALPVHRCSRVTHSTLVLFACSFLASATSGAQQPQMVDVGGHKLQMTGSGQGTPAVVFEAAGFTRRREAGVNSLDPAQRAEMDGLSRILTTGQLGVPGNLPDVPIVVLTSLRSAASQGPRAPGVWRQLHAEIFQSVTYGMHIVTNRSGHLIQQDEPELVVNSVRWVVDAVRRPR